MKKNIQNTSVLQCKPSGQHGFAMIEVLISVVILSVGLLGLAGLQVVGMKGTQHAGMKMQATLLTQSLLEKIRANPNGDYEQTIDCSNALPKDCGSVQCGVDQLAAYDLYRVQCGTKSGGQLLGGISSLLVNGKIVVNCPVSCDAGLTITTSWDERVIDEHDMTVDGVLSKKLQLSAMIK